jgi:hypothetical protein
VVAQGSAFLLLAAQAWPNREVFPQVSREAEALFLPKQEEIPPQISQEVLFWPNLEVSRLRAALALEGS